MTSQQTYAGARQRVSSPGQVITTVVYGRQWSLSYQGRTWRPPTDVYETADAVVVKLEVAGMSEEDFDIAFVDGNLLIRGIRHDPTEKLGYHQMEISYGEFRVEVYLPVPILPDRIAATYQNGFLLVSLPKEHRRY
jgi:HSP20 family protein